MQDLTFLGISCAQLKINVLQKDAWSFNTDINHVAKPMLKKVCSQ